MPSIYLPSTESYEYLKGLVHGFCLELDEDGEVALMLKLEASLINSVISGTPISIVIRNPHIRKRSCTIYIYDLPDQPFYITWMNFGGEDDIWKDFDAVIAQLALRSERVILALFNEITHCIFRTELQLAPHHTDFLQWLEAVYNDPRYNDVAKSDDEIFFPEDEINGFEIKVLNTDHSDAKKLIIIAPT